MDSILTEIKDGVRCANRTSSQFQCDDHVGLIFEQLAKECGFSKSGRVQVWTHLKDKDLSIQFDLENFKLWVEYKYQSDHKHIYPLKVSDFINEVLSFIRDFYMSRKA